MAADIYYGLDCCVDSETPTHPPRLSPRTADLELNDSIIIRIDSVWPECAEWCFSWRIMSGVGWLDHKTGLTNWYHAPPTAWLCEQSPVIRIYCRGEPIDEIAYSVNGFPRTVVAALVAHQWDQPYFSWWLLFKIMGTGALIYKGLHPDYFVIRVDEIACGGIRIARHAYAALTVAEKTGSGVRLNHGKFHLYWLKRTDVPEFDLNTGEVKDYKSTQNIEQLLQFKPDYYGSLDGAKTYLLNQALFDIRYGLPTRSMIASGLKTFTWFVPQPSQWGPGDVIDVRSKELAEKGCCNAYLAQALLEEE